MKLLKKILNYLLKKLNQLKHLIFDGLTGGQATLVLVSILVIIELIFMDLSKYIKIC